MKRFFLYLTASLFLFISGNAQINQDFASVTNIHALTNKCWQFYGASLVSPETSYDKFLSLTSPTVNGTAWVRTAYIQLTSSSAISFSYQAAQALPDGATRTISVSVLGLNGIPTLLKQAALTPQDGTRPYTFSCVSPVNDVQRLVIEITSAGDEAVPVYIDNLKVEGTFDYNPPYSCKEGNDGATSIHYLKSFTGQSAASRVDFQWTVVENENNKYFEIERSTDGRNFSPVATLNATENVAVESYRYQSVLTASAFYRLKLVSKGGIRMYSNVLFFRNEPAGKDLSLLQNPVTHTLKLQFYAEAQTKATVALYSVNGTRVLQRVIAAQKGHNLLALPLDATVKPGMYVVEVVNGNMRATTKMVKQ